MRKKKDYAKKWVDRASIHFKKSKDTIYKWEREGFVELLEFLKKDKAEYLSTAQSLKKEIADMKYESN